MFYSKLQYFTDSAIHNIVSIIWTFPYDIQIIAFIIFKIVGISIAIALFLAALLGAAIYHGNIGGPGVDIAIRELFKKKKKRDS
jgi:hypothetical protein